MNDNGGGGGGEGEVSAPFRSRNLSPLVAVHLSTPFSSLSADNSCFWYPDCTKNKYQCCGYRMFIPESDPNFSIPDPESTVKIILDPGSQIQVRIKELKFFYQKNCFLALRIMIRVVHSASRIRILIFYTSRIRIQGSKRQGSRINQSGSAILMNINYFIFTFSLFVNVLRGRCR